jgi:predicted RNA-binding Zn ribbon-like protein
MPAPVFQLLASHPALDFVNTLDNRFVVTGPTERLCTYTELLAFLEQSGLLSLRQINALQKKSKSVQTNGVLTRVHELRERLGSVFYEIVAKGAPRGQFLKRIEGYSLEAQSHRQLFWGSLDASKDDPHRAFWDWKPSENDVALPLWAISLSASELLTSTALPNVHECGSQTCRWLFLDTSKNHTRRWCDMTTCGNRMKARRFQARR